MGFESINNRPQQLVLEQYYYPQQSEEISYYQNTVFPLNNSVSSTAVLGDFQYIPEIPYTENNSALNFAADYQRDNRVGDISTIQNIESQRLVNILFNNYQTGVNFLSEMQLYSQLDIPSLYPENSYMDNMAITSPEVFDYFALQNVPAEHSYPLQTTYINNHPPLEYFGVSLDSTQLSFQDKQQNLPLSEINSKNHNDIQAPKNVLKKKHKKHAKNLTRLGILDVRKGVVVEKYDIEMDKINSIKKSIINIYKTKGIPFEIKKRMHKNINELKNFLEESLSKNKIHKARNQPFQADRIFERISAVIWFFIDNWKYGYTDKYISYFENSNMPSEWIKKCIDGVDAALIEENKK